MIFAHLIIGTIPIEDKFSWFWFIGSIIPDIDHLFIILKKKIFSYSKLMDSLVNEEKYGIVYKTKYCHSMFGAVMFSIPVLIFSFTGGVYFLVGYFLHLILDFPDKDEKQYFFPFKKKVKGWWPILSKQEIIFTIILLIFIIKIYV
jgi:hypothetical protein